MRVLLSIKPEFATKIFDGTKRYEFRRSIFKRKDISSVIVYASSPVCLVVGEFEIQRILSDHVNSLWLETEAFSGITKEYYDGYFHKKDIAYAIGIGKVTRYKTPHKLSDYKVHQAPQSFCYVD